MKSWKTSLVGILGGLLMSGPEIYHLIFTGTPFDPKAFIGGMVVLVLGLLSKDFNKTGV
jgi:hypothetical protein